MRTKRTRAWAWLAALPLVGCASPLLRRGPQISYAYDEEQGALGVLVDGELFTRYFGIAKPKPYFYPLLAPGGLPVTRGFPFEERDGEERDHPHHVSLWYAHGDVDGRDFWHGSDPEAHMTMRTFPIPDAAREVETSQYWISREQVLATDHRRISFGATESARWIDFEITIEPEGERLTLGDTKEGTFALRLAPTLRVQGERAAGSLLDSEGREDAAAWGKRARWLAARGPVEGVDVTVALFDHPRNPRHPTWWHARTYGLLAANPFGAHDFEGAPEGSGDLVLRAPTTFRYRVLVALGRMSPEELEAVWASFARE